MSIYFETYLRVGIHNGDGSNARRVSITNRPLWRQTVVWHEKRRIKDGFTKIRKSVRTLRGRNSLIKAIETRYLVVDEKEHAIVQKLP